MNWSTQRLADKGIYLQVGHASQVLVEVWLVWVLAALLAVLYTWFTLPPKRSQE